MHGPSPDQIAFANAQRVGRLATVNADGSPAAVPVCFAMIGSGGAPMVVTPLDAKPKSTGVRQLARVRNIVERPVATLLLDEYSEAWSRLAWLSLKGRARLIEPDADDHAAAISALREKYLRYRSMPIDRNPVIAIDRLRAMSWSGAGIGGDTAPFPRAGQSGLEDLLRSRRSVRAFRPDPVPATAIRAAIEAAGWAPSPHGRQPWRFAVVEAPARRTALAEAMAATWDTQLRFDGQDDAIVRHRIARSKERMTTAPVLVIPCLYLADLDHYPDADRQQAETVMAIQSIGAAIQNFLLSIHAAGLDAGWMCAPLFCPEIVRRELGLAETLHPHAMIPVGYAAKDPVRRERRPVEDLIIGWE
jgi:coenzyme F420-0:L-glutamate ligase / coenzyme F420-1:gamma-L-glutamate ligase